MLLLACICFNFHWEWMKCMEGNLTMHVWSFCHLYLLIRYVLSFLYMKLNMLIKAFEQEHFDLQPIWPAFPNRRSLLVLKHFTWTFTQTGFWRFAWTQVLRGEGGGEMEVEFLRYILSLFPSSTESSCHPCHHQTSLYIFAIFHNKLQWLNTI